MSDFKGGGAYSLQWLGCHLQHLEFCDDCESLCVCYRLIGIGGNIVTQR